MPRDDTPTILLALAESVPSSIEFHSDGNVTVTGDAVVPVGAFDPDADLDLEMPAHLTSW